MFAKIAGTGSYLPKKLVDNNELSKTVDTSDEWIRTRTGVCSRHIAEDDTVVSMSIAAAKDAIKDAGIVPEAIEMIIVSTVSSEQLLPCAACEVQAAIGATNAACFDLNAACAGFISAYQVVAAQMKAGMIKTALIIGAECLSNIVDWTDRGTCILFGDGAGAAIVTCKDENIQIPAVLQADGSKGAVLSCNSGIGNDKAPYGKYVAMDGREIYKFAVKQVPKVIHQILDQAGHEADEIDYFILHQANKRIIESIAKHLHQDINKFPMNMMENGNMSSASIPVLLDQLNKEGKLKPGMKIIIAGFGAGLTWGGCYLEW
jgi:3-oxoacyl-[acyl-carrier-protein] synthase-3